MISIKKYELNKPAEGVPFVETKIELPLAATPVQFLIDGDKVSMFVMHDDQMKLYEERFILVRSDVSLVEIFGGDPWNYRQSMKDGDNEYHVFVFMTTAERMRVEQQRIQVMQQLEMMNKPAPGRQGPPQQGGSGLILPGK